MLLSVITINFNNSIGLEKTINSVVVQTYKNIEYIIIDGGSSDNSIDVIQRNENLLHYWVSEKDRGIYNAMNKGIVKATGDYLLFLNSGDFLVKEDVIERLFEGEQGEADLIYGDLQRSFPDGSSDIVQMRDFIDVETMMDWTLCHPVTLISKRLFMEYGYYDERLKIVADWAFFLKVIVLGKATQKHKNIIVSNFSMDGMSSLDANQRLIDIEREWVKTTYLSSSFMKLYGEYLKYKKVFNNKWVGLFIKILVRIGRLEI